MERTMVMDAEKKEGFGKIGKILAAVAAIAIGVGSGFVISLLFGDSLETLIPNYWALQFVHQLILSVTALGLVFLYRKRQVLRCTAAGMKEGLACGAAWLLMPVLAALNVLLKLRETSGLSFISRWEIGLLMLQCILIGLSEECIFRGIVTELSLEVFGDSTKRRARLAIAFASLLFAAMHLVNALQPEITFKAALMQAFAAFGAGLVYGAIYYRSGRSIVPCIIFHTIQDAAAFAANGSLFGVTQEEAIGQTGIVQAVYSLVFIFWFFYLMREQKEE